MTSKLENKKQQITSNEAKIELAKIFEEIDAQRKLFEDKKSKVKEEQERGARITKHRFTV